ncbi:MAG: hypothetical protein K8F27_11020, partial [Sulfuricellaceae bacterium]|nr:hypothetical protein [Sulfuricellaceae bacterium]
ITALGNGFEDGGVELQLFECHDFPENTMRLSASRFKACAAVAGLNAPVIRCTNIVANRYICNEFRNY